MDVAKTTPPAGSTPAQSAENAASLSASADSNAPANATCDEDAGANPTGRQFVISSGGYRAVVTEVGAGLRELGHCAREHGVDGTLRPLVLGYGEQEVARSGAGQLLAPWPNRVAGGRYSFDGEDRQLDISEPASGNAIHGLVRWSSWTVSEHAPDRIVLTYRLHPHPGYPHTLDLTAAYSVSEAGLEVEVRARNAGPTTAPYGYASHPYLTPGVEAAAGTIDAWTLHLPAERWLTVDERMIPTGSANVDASPYDFRSPRTVGVTSLDTAFGGLQRELDGIGRVRVSEPGGGAVTLWVDRGLEWIQVFTGDPLPGAWKRAGVAVEPMSCPPDAFNSGTDVIRLEPGGEAGHRWGIHAG
jgi:aldose 1-epimerase